MAGFFVSSGQAFYKLLRYYVRFGAQGSAAFRRAHPKGASTVYSAITDRGSEIYLRPNTTDVLVYEQIFLQRDVGLPNIETPRFIMDAGAHIGCSAVYFAERYPDADILAIEPDAGNYELLCRNTRPFRNVRCICGAIWDRSTIGHISNPTCSSWGFRMEESSTGAPGIPMYALGSLLSSSGHEYIDVLKLDIEGAERKVFANEERYEWLPKTKVIIVELHDHIATGCTESFFAAIREYRYKCLKRTLHNQIVEIS